MATGDRFMASWWESLRRPVPPRGAAASIATFCAGIVPLAAALSVRDSNLQARFALSGIGLVVFTVGVMRPRFAWHFDNGWRGLLGDRLYAALWIIVGVGVVAAAWLAPLK